MSQQFNVREALTRLHDEYRLSNADIGVLILTSPSTVAKVRYGHTSGRNIAGRVRILIWALDAIQKTAKRPASHWE